MTDKYYIPYYSIQDSYRTEEQIKDNIFLDSQVPIQMDSRDRRNEVFNERGV